MRTKNTKEGQIGTKQIIEGSPVRETTNDRSDILEEAEERKNEEDLKVIDLNKLI